MTYRIEIIAGQTFVGMTSADGRKRTMPPLIAITELKANIQALNEHRLAIEAEASNIVSSMRQSLAAGADTSAHRTRMTELKRMDYELVSSINSANEQIHATRAAATRAEAESIANAAHANIATALTPLEIGDLA
ncbi:hypothetical protein [Fluviibacter phosphoraccumulans]|jgi:hypothetical protein|uniref:Uncharacterized protein n=2 Tax=Fluviibacter phosphoraccumulans TaxID=1751046 RepID=A0A679HUA5_9RHOO|nr:hypothetical protein [Fluviibacter phosphoraccumulans]BBU70059.1 hypothetical protein ICHIAU1_23420 [Fluviibacter phosphoraccumulans]BBU70749.1 hypothetical protein ICHIJ1_06680 [Fluviibacter phosphoraccumulans]BCA65896.1 hypothetical protein SHINM1_014980 [Fluviibacter phosphoraccumulans]